MNNPFDWLKSKKDQFLNWKNEKSTQFNNWKDETLSGIKNWWGSLFGQNLSNADREEMQENERMAKEADERDFQYDLRGLRESPQAQVEGFLNAGLNPAMMYGSTNPTYAQGQGTAPTVDSSQGMSFNDLVAPFVELAMMKSRMDLTKAQVGNVMADTKKKEVETEGAGLQNTITKDSLDSIIELNKLRPQELQSQIDLQIKQAKTEDERASLLVLQQSAQEMSNEQFARMMDLVYEYQEVQLKMLKTSESYQRKQLEADLSLIYRRCEEIMQNVAYSKEAQKYLKDKSFAQVLGGILNNLLNRDKKTTKIVQDALDEAAHDIG